jgi:hypothetical protein
MSSLWMSIEPNPICTRLLLSRASSGIDLKALLPPMPAQPKALALLLEALVAWYNLPLTAVLDADAEDVHHHPEIWADWLGDLTSPQIAVAWGAPPPPRSNNPADRDRQRFFAKMGDYARAKRLISFASGGLP